ncbi:MAG: sodium:proton antiporter [Saprospiraceae bacterium]|nr:sodium:proton antiporter [Saprospiraceae bacterium]
MTVTIIITFCVLALIAYVFDLTSAKTRIPSVILLLLLGWAVRQLTNFLDIDLPDFFPFLPVLGSIGLILIVLEGSLELEINKTKYGLIGKSFLGALLPIIALAASMSLLFSYYGDFGLKESIINALPLCVISSAIAIPSVRNLAKSSKEFVIYESSLSDILGVLIFNFLIFNDIINAASFGSFFLQILIIILVSFVATLLLAYLLNKIDHHVKFVPIILFVVLIYEVSKIFHLPGLIFILIFGLFIGNLDELRQFKWIEKLKPDELNKEVKKFRDLTIEGAFLIRALFFILFGYLIETSEVLNPNSLLLAIAIVFCIFFFRFIQLKLSKLPLMPLLFIAPRGLITILLFLSIDPLNSIPIVNSSLIIQVIILSALIMMVGLVITKTRKEESPISVETNEAVEI